MTRVHELDPETVDRIAAGEVVTRPAAVVTELVENSLDAGSESITIAVERGGLDRIRVADDGHGMTEADALLAVERHTTSKIDGIDDVGRVRTLGFRGEALPSIAEAARLDLTTKAVADGARGTRVVVENGEKRSEPAGRDVGTTVEVTDLFARTPARRKSLAGPKTEFSRISALCTRYALLRPDVRFRLSHDDRETFATPGTGDPTDALLGVYDRQVAGASTTVEWSAPDDGSADREVSVSGVVCYPSVTRARPTHVHTAVNSRAVENGDLRQAVVAGYGDLLAGGRYPVAAIDVSVPPERVDANVHPAKERVAFVDGEAVTAAVESAVRDALSGEDLARTADLAFDLDSSLTPVEGDSTLAEVTVIGTFRDLYLLCEADDDLLVIDQHAAHERVNFERLRAAVGDEVESAAIDPPETLRLSADESATLEANRDLLASLGYRVADFGGTTYRVEAVPAPLGRVEPTAALRDALDALAVGETPEDAREDLLRDLACHPSLKAGDALSVADATRLVNRLGACEQPYACPHGRPTVLSLDEATLATAFERGNTRLG
ncbi:DNA mismatch repair endonuclease MutL [Salinirubrum litoreum]|uniref:DNA mismatch repair protein MutL n=1 Tax=Salinirubrum litoreum TaxID=1126234 RepID=A0ABD5RDH3_9EURY|nr:DNA mismatch repair endonuclease MutL [Salinirubrum litoreum]